VFIYKLTNKINGKSYIGQSCRNVEKRWNEHLMSALSTDESQKKYLQNSINTHGWENFDKEILEEIPVEKGQKYLDEREFYYILKYGTYVGYGKGYNLTLGGSGVKGYCRPSKPKTETNKERGIYNYASYNVKTGEREKIFKSAREAASAVGGKRYEHINASGDWFLGKGKYAKTYKGFIWMKLPKGENFPEKINIESWSQIKKVKPKTTWSKSKEVGSEKHLYEIAQYDLSGKRAHVWENNLSEIERDFKAYFPQGKLTYNQIVEHLKGRNFSAGGFFWKRYLKGQSPEKIDVMSEYVGYEFTKEKFAKKPIVKLGFNGGYSKHKSIKDLPDLLYSNSDKVQIYKACEGENNHIYDGYEWYFEEDIDLTK